MRRDNKKQDNKKEFEQRLIEVKRVTRVTKGGKRLRFRACVVIGNRKGKVGMGVAKSTDVALAVDKAVARAKKALITIPNYSTVPCIIKEKSGSAEIMLKPATEGTSIVSGGPVRAVLELAGISNVVSKVVKRSNNKISNIKATLSALEKLNRFQNLKNSKFGDKQNNEKPVSEENLIVDEKPVFQEKEISKKVKSETIKKTTVSKNKKEEK
ncbi:30S ribosomal protein S5 [bacterium]|nr:30S ribosomal protein S5 [bacterium]